MGVVDYRFGVSPTLLPKIEVYSMPSPLEESISFPECGKGRALGSGELGKAGKGSQPVSNGTSQLSPYCKWFPSGEGLSNLLQFKWRAKDGKNPKGKCSNCVCSVF